MVLDGTEKIRTPQGLVQPEPAGNRAYASEE